MIDEDAKRLAERLLLRLLDEAEAERDALAAVIIAAHAALERLRAGLQEICDFIPPAVAEGDPYHEIAIHSRRKARALLDASKQADGPTSGLDDTTNTGDAPCTP